jgi:hypothetical protein
MSHTQTQQAAPAILKEGDDSMTMEEMEKMLVLADEAFGAAREVSAMKGQYFTDSVQYGVEAARKMAFFVK